jgi:protein phosphatase
MISIIGASHPGLREHNEDCYLADSCLGLGLVADGMGGYACGEVASQIVQQTVLEAVTNNESLQGAIARAHARIKDEAAADPARKGMGTTAIALKIQGSNYEIAWVGDSRGYLWSPVQAELRQITRDHSYVEQLLTSGAITPEEAIHHPDKNLITQAVGVAGEDGLEIEQVRGRLQPGQQLILCSDGLVDEVLDEDIATILAAADTPQQALDKLIQTAVNAGGRDNITVVIATNDAKASVDDICSPDEVNDDSGIDCSRLVGSSWSTRGSDMLRTNLVMILNAVIVILVASLALMYLAR